MKRHLTTTGLLAVLAACGGGGGATNPPTVTPAITLSASSTSATIVRGTSTTTTLTLTRSGGFSGPVVLSATDRTLNGLTVTFSPAVIPAGSTTSTATIAASSGAVVANALPIDLTASGGGVASQSVTFAVSVPQPAIVLSLGSSAVTGVPGTVLTVPITVTRVNGAEGLVSVSVGGFPSGVSPSVSLPTVSAGPLTGSLTIDLSTIAPLGTHTLIVLARTSGLPLQTTTLQLTITPSPTLNIALSASPSAVTMRAGQSGTSTLTLARGGSYSGDVTLSLDDPPAGITAAFAPAGLNADTPSSDIVSPAVVPGLYNLVVRAVGSGVAPATTTIALTVGARSSIGLTTIANQSLAQGASSAGRATCASTAPACRTPLRAARSNASLDMEGCTLPFESYDNGKKVACRLNRLGEPLEAEFRFNSFRPRCEKSRVNSGCCSRAAPCAGIVQ